MGGEIDRVDDEDADSIFEDWTGVNRTLCAVLREMRKCYKTHNYSYLPGLIEEAQSMGNRMEMALSDQKDLVRLTEKISKAKKVLAALKEEYGVRKRDGLKKSE